jgi:hypothetical protein
VNAGFETARLAWPFLFANAASKPIIETFRRTTAGLHEEKATSVVESLPYIASQWWGDR